MIDWNQAKIRYITTPITKSELAGELGCSRRSVLNHARSEGWDALRQDFDDEVTEQTIEDAKRQAVGFAQNLAETAERLLGKIDAVLDAGEDLSSREIKSLTSAMTDLMGLRGVRLQGSEEDNRVVVEFADREDG